MENIGTREHPLDARQGGRHRVELIDNPAKELIAAGRATFFKSTADARMLPGCRREPPVGIGMIRAIESFATALR